MDMLVIFSFLQLYKWNCAYFLVYLYKISLGSTPKNGIAGPEGMPIFCINGDCQVCSPPIPFYILINQQSVRMVFFL